MQKTGLRFGGSYTGRKAGRLCLILGWFSIWQDALPNVRCKGTLPHMNPTPHVAATAPAKVELEAGKDYWFCTCGLSATQPFCDGSHKGKGFAPQKFTADKTGPAWLCQCKQTENAPFCDGAHKGLIQPEQ